jgi:hypothetical protein
MRILPISLIVAAMLAGCGSSNNDSGPFTVDADGDGFSAPEDCDDANAAINPDAVETCNGIDDDCDTVVDEDQPDTDKDGVVDCADTEECDGLDNDGDGTVDEDFADTDLDGTADCVDTEECDGLDNDGDGLVDEDQPDTDLDGIVDCQDTEDCDGLDNDGDGDVDEGFTDTDLDGIADCMDVEECDGLDNDGDGMVDEDFPDTDLDGTADCVDTEECDGLDNDGDGEVDEGFDTDGDGFSACSDDCDDTDPDVHPGAADWMNDGFDSDCDGEEPGLWTLDEAPIYIQGASGLYDVLGHGIGACDFDEDGLDDLVIGSPFNPYGSYHGKVGIFYGANSSSWTTAMSMSDADTVIEGDGYDFIGFNAKCGDIDGDGHADLVFNRGDISYTTFYNVYSIMIYYGDGTAFASSLGEEDADAELSYTVGSLSTRTTVYAAEFAIGDIDADGTDDIVIEWPYTTLHGQGEILVLPGSVYSGALALDDYLSDWWSPDQPLQADMITTGGYDYQQIQILGDLDGDGFNDVFVGEPYWSTTAGSATYQGQASVMSGVHDAAGSALADIAYGQFTSTTAAQYFGYWATSADFLGDDALDGAISAVGDATMATNGGGFWVWNSLGSVLTKEPPIPTDSAVAHIYGSTSGGKLGYRLAAAGDVNGDGYEDILVSEPFGGSAAKGRVWLVSGALLSGEAAVEDVALWGCEGTTTDDGTGLLGDLIGSSLLGNADFDGDGQPDIVLAAVNWDDAHSSTVRSGRVAIWLSGGK